MVGRRVESKPFNSLKVVYKYITAAIGNIDTNISTVTGRIDRTRKNAPKMN